MLALALAASLFAAPLPQTVPAPPVDPMTAPVDLEDVVVEGSRLEDTTERFVREVGAPARSRGLARWRGGVCAGVVNLRSDAAQFIVDRVSDTARDLDLRVGAPGCEPSVLVIATTDAKTFTPQFVASRPRLFRVGGGGMDRGGVALTAFENSDRPVRWWHVSVPVDDTGRIAVRMPGYCENECRYSVDFAPKIRTTSSRLLAQTEDDLKRVFIIVDVDKIADVSLEQLADYIAMVALAQIDPDADTEGYSTILNLFDAPGDIPGLTQWDKAYLQGLYDAQRTLRNLRSARVEVASSIIRARRDMTEEQPLP